MEDLLKSAITDSEDTFSTYQGRLKTFTGSWPFQNSEGSLSKHEMAKAGFWYVKGDCVQCYYCEKELEGWEEDDNAFEEHKKHAAYCPFVNMFSEPPNTVTVQQAIELEKNKLLLKIQRNFDNWLQEIRAANKEGIAKISRKKGLLR